MMPLNLQTFEGVPSVGYDFRYHCHVPSGNMAIAFLLCNESFFVYCMKLSSSGILPN